MEKEQPTMILPLCWPASWAESSEFLRDFPLFGKNARGYRAMKRQQKTRPENCIDLFPEEHRELAKQVCGIIQREGYWPNDRFIPADPCAILLTDTGHEWTGVSIIMDIEHEFDVDTSEILDFEPLTLGELIVQISSLKASGKRRQIRPSLRSRLTKRIANTVKSIGRRN